jgi:hypothetical protein
MVHLAAAMASGDCELVRGGWLAQPANALSSTAFVFVGAWLAWTARRPGVHRAALVAGAVGLTAVGLGSIAYHGPQPGWAPLAHDGAIGVLAVAGIGLFGAALAQGRAKSAGPLTAWKQAAGWMAVALVAFVTGRTGSPLCDPTSPWQPHAVWHLLSAVALGRAVRACAQLRPTGDAPPGNVPFDPGGRSPFGRMLLGQGRRSRAKGLPPGRQTGRGGARLSDR